MVGGGLTLATVGAGDGVGVAAGMGVPSSTTWVAVTGTASSVLLSVASAVMRFGVASIVGAGEGVSPSVFVGDGVGKGVKVGGRSGVNVSVG